MLSYGVSRIGQHARCVGSPATCCHARTNPTSSNPRVHMRKKFLKKQKARRGQVTAMREHEGAVYGGESSGIRTRLARSHKLA